MSFTERVENWRARGRAESFRGRSIHVMSRPGEGPLVVMLHGFPTSSYDWRRLIAELGGERILAFDFLGFGLSEKPRDHNYTLAWQADLTEELVDRHGDGRPALICAHDMGASVATELMARELAGELGFGIAAVLMTNGSILLERSNPTFAQKVLRSRVGPVAARITSEAFFKRQFGSIFSERHPLSPAEESDQWSLITHDGGRRLGHKLVSYMDERLIYASRWHGAVRDWEGQLQLAWGMDDPVAGPEVLEGLLELRPELPAVRLEQVGHYPQIEAPSRLAEVLRSMIAGSRASL